MNIVDKDNGIEVRWMSMEDMICYPQGINTPEEKTMYKEALNMLNIERRARDEKNRLAMVCPNCNDTGGNMLLVGWEEPTYWCETCGCIDGLETMVHARAQYQRANEPISRGEKETAQ